MGNEFNYYSGQWIDCYADINGERQIVGYSIASSPTTKDTIELAIKLSDNPITQYIHTRAQVGDSLYIEGGQGDIYYTRKLGNKIVIIAAGIGIAPMMSILRYANSIGDVDVKVIYGASSDDELAYLDEICSITNANPRITHYITVSDSKTKQREGRIDATFLNEVELDIDAVFFICGPQPMIHSIVNILKNIGIQDSQIRYEVWW